MTSSGAPRFGLLSLIVTIGLLIWQYNMVTKYAEGSLYDGNHVLMTTTCGSIFSVMHKSLMLTILLAGLEIYILGIAIVPEFTVCCWPCLFIAACGACMAGIAKLVVSIMGIIVVARANRAECSECADLYNCAWYVFIGMLIFSLATGCFAGCCLEKPTAGEKQPLVESNDAEQSKPQEVA
mmetsp:Transcript_15085/g.33187  ORF Transcript_15085/g.33187 Transcript_15085/m.33187 type:complete len:181 (-) Transcript_15085:79-621(-)|eukprot:CAMPEP_0170597386 /NCGR_PEP_ID=MMETSP0224-20130122/15682_1 /TAXON_ID=285029 /ORGANISM="Togula jolla, Strain CCCM 725" /LENGTH=180 /DNA_ID=CAMNT_0010921859 /DNA_START=72 /DNA_END=614 /DNA_ORIENTATION=-